MRDFDDLEALMSEAFLIAIEKFDFDRHKNEEGEYVHDTSMRKLFYTCFSWHAFALMSIVEESTHAKQRGLSLRGMRVRKELYNSLGGGDVVLELLDEDELMSAALEIEGSSLEYIFKIARARKLHSKISLNQQIGNGADNGAELIDFIADNNVVDGYRVIQNARLRRCFQEFTKGLGERDRVIMTKRIYVDSDEVPLRLCDLRERFQVSKERIRQLEVDIKKRLKAYLIEQGIRD